MTYYGTVQGGVVILDDEAHGLRDGTRVHVDFREKHPSLPDDPDEETVGQRMLKLAGLVSDLPSDAALNHDHYLYGAPKRDHP